MVDRAHDLLSAFDSLHTCMFFDCEYEYIEGLLEDNLSTQALMASALWTLLCEFHYAFECHTLWRTLSPAGG